MSAIARMRPGVPRSWASAEKRTADRPVRRGGMSASQAGNQSGYASQAQSTNAPARTTAYVTKRREREPDRGPHEKLWLREKSERGERRAARMTRAQREDHDGDGRHEQERPL